MIRLQTPLNTFTAAAVLLDRHGDIYLLDESGDYAPSLHNLHHYSDGGLRNTLIYTLEDEEPLTQSHNGTELRPIDTRQLGFRPWTDPAGREMYRSDDEDRTGKGLGIALLYDGSWRTAADLEGPELFIAPASFFASFTGRQPIIAALGPRGRLSALAARSYA